jgi:hypothetical protein
MQLAAPRMSEPKVPTFFYGSYMNPAVLADVQIFPDSFEVTRLDGYDISITHRANLIASDRHCVYGVLAMLTHAELARLYEHASHVLGEIYLPHPVLTTTRHGSWRPALCYIAPSMKPGRPDAAYVNRIVAPARQFEFPDWYIERLEASLPVE